MRQKPIKISEDNNQLSRLVGCQTIPEVKLGQNYYIITTDLLGSPFKSVPRTKSSVTIYPKITDYIICIQLNTRILLLKLPT